MRSQRTAIVTGGTHGLGHALVMGLARHGTRVYTLARGRPALARLARAAAAHDLPIVPVLGDVADGAAIGRLARRLAADRCRVHLVIHNAGRLGPRAPLADWPRREFERVMAVNVVAAQELTRRLVPRLGRQAVLAFVSSGVTDAPRTGWGAYEVSKVAVERLAAIYALELAPRGVRTVILQPGAMRTRMRAAAYPLEDPASVPTPEAVADRLLAALQALPLDAVGEVTTLQP